MHDTPRGAALATILVLLLAACGTAADDTAERATDGVDGGLVVDPVGPSGPPAVPSEQGPPTVTDSEMAAEDAGEAETAQGSASDRQLPGPPVAPQPPVGPAPPDAPADPGPPAPRRDQAVLVNPFVDAQEDPLSTFALDVDTASFTQSLAWLESGQLPPAGIVRPEEFLNWFEYGYPEPARGWAIATDGLRVAPWDPGRSVLRVGLATASIDPAQRPDATLVFVVDTSGSMEGPPLRTVKDTLLTLVDRLRPSDRIGLVAYGSTAQVLLRPTALAESDDVRRAIGALTTEGSTNAEEGLRLGYQLARDSLAPGTTTTVVLASDGVANVGATGPDEILATIGAGVDLGIHLLALGVTDGTYDDYLMEQLADRGDGAVFYVRDRRDAERLFVDRLEETLVVAAVESKVQVAFAPGTVRAHRLVGYENRAIADEDFRDDTVDAGEVGAGHEVTALYELVLEPGTAADDRLATVQLRWEDPATRVVEEVALDVTLAELVPDPTTSLQTALAAAALADVLRGSPHLPWSPVELAQGLEGPLDPTILDALQRAARATPAPGG